MRSSVGTPRVSACGARRARSGSVARSASARPWARLASAERNPASRLLELGAAPSDRLRGSTSPGSPRREPRVRRSLRLRERLRHGRMPSPRAPPARARRALGGAWPVSLHGCGCGQPGSSASTRGAFHSGRVPRSSATGLAARSTSSASSAALGRTGQLESHRVQRPGAPRPARPRLRPAPQRPPTPCLALGQPGATSAPRRRAPRQPAGSARSRGTRLRLERGHPRACRRRLARARRQQGRPSKGPEPWPVARRLLRSTATSLRPRWARRAPRARQAAAPLASLGRGAAIAAVQLGRCSSSAAAAAR